MTKLYSKWIQLGSLVTILGTRCRPIRNKFLCLLYSRSSSRFTFSQIIFVLKITPLINTLFLENFTLMGHLLQTQYGEYVRKVWQFDTYFRKCMLKYDFNLLHFRSRKHVTHHSSSTSSDSDDERRFDRRKKKSMAKARMRYVLCTNSVQCSINSTEERGPDADISTEVLVRLPCMNKV